MQLNRNASLYGALPMNRGNTLMLQACYLCHNRVVVKAVTILYPVIAVTLGVVVVRVVGLVVVVVLVDVVVDGHTGLQYLSIGTTALLTSRLAFVAGNSGSTHSSINISSHHRHRHNTWEVKVRVDGQREVSRSVRKLRCH